MVYLCYHTLIIINVLFDGTYRCVRPPGLYYYSTGALRHAELHQMALIHLNQFLLQSVLDYITAVSCYSNIIILLDTIRSVASPYIKEPLGIRNLRSLRLAETLNALSSVA